MKEGVCHLLELQILQQPAFALAFSQVQVHTRFIQLDLLFIHFISLKSPKVKCVDQSFCSSYLFPQFIVGPFMDVLSETSLFHK